MKKIINQIARYSFGAMLLFLLLTLACAGNSENKVAEFVFPIAFILFMIAIMLTFSTYITHLFWMLAEEPCAFPVKQWLLSSIGLSIVLTAFLFFQGSSILRILGSIVFCFAVTGFSEIGKYVFQWTLDQN